MTINPNGNVYIDWGAAEDDDHPVCHECGEQKDKSEFCAHTPGNWYVCLECHSKKAKASTQKRSRANLAVRLRRDFGGMTLAQYDAILEAQGNKCATCDTTDPNENGLSGWCINYAHDGVDQLVRGINCHKCNQELMKYHSVEAMTATMQEMIERFEAFKCLLDYMVDSPAQAIVPGLRCNK